ncbi:type I-C CRISPR-associated protein Cas5c [Streptomyces hoynatensis]|uniref:pre-crRNA processing endonuclease n=1 Tax=Streptomyces hoynatensis TaxID=1141874 RepID=A0A3A9YVL5_9ACTN|nr:type I-C CRISPR-associated protein Cas5c [Streptomyces hoynatensis]RKN39246.1 type I-C CRISPR-associated protein Cas5 [Streptomyces hoynatensis]
MTSTPSRKRLARRPDPDGWTHPDIVVETSGALACFTRPELKVERVSYPVMTPSAARGLLEAIFWKPQFTYVIRRIEVLKEIEWTQLRRNEVKSTISDHQVRALRADPSHHYDVERDRDQRNTVALRDVAYRIHTQLRVHPDAGAPEAKYRDQLRRRIVRGACFSQPFLGCREFSADFGPATDRSPIPRNEELGIMLHSIEYADGGERYRWFRAQLKAGVLTVEEPLPESAVAMPSGPWRADAGER